MILYCQSANAGTAPVLFKLASLEKKIPKNASQSSAVMKWSPIFFQPLHIDSYKLTPFVNPITVVGRVIAPYVDIIPIVILNKIITRITARLILLSLN